MIKNLSQKQFNTISFIIVILTALAVYLPYIGAHAISFDDKEYFLDNPLVKNPSISSIVTFFKEVTIPTSVRGYYQPLALTSLMIDSALGADKNNLTPVHTTSLLLHIGITYLLFIFLIKLTKNRLASLLGSLLFCIHPIAVEPVLWISERKTLISAFFGMLALVYYMKYIENKNRYNTIMLYVMFVLSLLGKPYTVVLPLLFLAIDYYLENKISLQKITEKLPLILISAIFGTIAILSQKNTCAMVIAQKLSIADFLYILNFKVSYYLYKIFLPFNITLVYLFEGKISILNFKILVSLLICSLLIVLMIISFRKFKQVFLSGMFFILPLIPTLGFLTITDSLVCYKYLYFPFVGVVLLFVFLLIKLFDYDFKIKYLKYGIVSLLSLLIITYSATNTKNYAQKWLTTDRLIEHNLTVNPDATIFLTLKIINMKENGATLEELLNPINKQLENKNIRSGELVSLRALKAEYYLEKGNFEKALEEYDKIKDSKGYENVYYDNVANVKLKQNLFLEAKDNYLKAIEYNQKDYEALNGLANALLNLNDKDMAYECIQNALAICPNNERYLCTKANILLNRGEFIPALSAIYDAMEVNKNYYQNYLLKGNILLFMNNSDAGIKQLGEMGYLVKKNGSKLLESKENIFLVIKKSYEKAIELNPKDAEAYVNLGILHAQNGLYKEALEFVDKGLAINPKSTEAKSLKERIFNDLDKTTKKG